MIQKATTIKDALTVLMDDARARGMIDLQVVYGSSIIRINFELIAANEAVLLAARQKGQR